MRNKIINFQVFNVETHGTCCWKAYSDIRFQGAPEDWQRVDEYPSVSMLLCKQINMCNIVHSSVLFTDSTKVAQEGLQHLNQPYFLDRTTN